MPASLSIKNVPDDVVERLRARAARNRRSLQGELLDLIERGRGRAPDDFRAGRCSNGSAT